MIPAPIVGEIFLDNKTTHASHVIETVFPPLTDEDGGTFIVSAADYNHGNPVNVRRNRAGQWEEYKADQTGLSYPNAIS